VFNTRLELFLELEKFRKDGGFTGLETPGIRWDSDREIQHMYNRVGLEEIQEKMEER